MENEGLQLLHLRVSHQAKATAMFEKCRVSSSTNGSVAFLKGAFINYEKKLINRFSPGFTIV